MDCIKCDATLCGKCCKTVNSICPYKCNSGFKKGHKMIKLLLNRVIVSCPNKGKYSDKINVCEAILPLPEMLDHLVKTCPFRVEKCNKLLNGYFSCPFSDFANRMYLHTIMCQSIN